MCFNCGFTSNSAYKWDSPELKNAQVGATQLMNDIALFDEDREIVWFPSVLNMDKFGVIYPCMHHTRAAVFDVGMSARGARGPKSQFSAPGVPFRAPGPSQIDPGRRGLSESVSRAPGTDLEPISDQKLTKWLESGGRPPRLFFRNYRGSRPHVSHKALRALRARGALGAREPRGCGKSAKSHLRIPAIWSQPSGGPRKTRQEPACLLQRASP